MTSNPVLLSQLRHGIFGRKLKMKKDKGSSKIYRIWNSMKQRCNNKNDHSYSCYGGRGIKVCERWSHSFDNFYEDMGDRPEGKTLDRIDNYGDYCKENCRWATKIEQDNNKTSNHFLIFNKKKLTVSNWAREIGIPRQILFKRIYLGWSIKKTLTTKIQEHKRHK